LDFYLVNHFCLPPESKGCGFEPRLRCFFALRDVLVVFLMVEGVEGVQAIILRVGFVDCAWWEHQNFRKMKEISISRQRLMSVEENTLTCVAITF
jgi:hypothetical protein